MSRPSFGELGGRDPYDILELPPDASEAEIRTARKRLLRRYHPDLPTGDLHRTQLITAAADLLLDPSRRDGYFNLRDEEYRRAAPTGATQPIRPTFVTPPADASAGAGPSAPAGRVPPADPFAAAWEAPAAGAAGESAPDAAGPRSGRRRGGHRPGGVGGHLIASRWNALAIASVVAILTWTPIPLVLGLLALRQIRRYDQRGARLAVTGTAVGAVFALVYLYILVVPGF